MNNFSQQLKYLRARDDISQRELAAKLGVSGSTIAMYESGKREPDFEMLEAIADFFNCDMAFLIGEQKQPLKEGLSLAKRELIDVIKTLSDDEVVAVLRLLKR